jgi:cytochrome c oxidase cbb3-type subunit I
MDPIIVLLSAFLISVVALGVFIWSMRNGVFGPASGGAKVIFTANEVGHVEDPAAALQSLTALQRTVDLKHGQTAAIVDGDSRSPGAQSITCMQRGGTSARCTLQR